jgi:uncharacterized protein YndB with AHSA1/START domain
MKSETGETTRALEMEVTIDAPIEAVWKAFSEADEMTRWFAPAASIDGGEGGRLWISWGPAAEGEAKIEVWEPNRRIAWRESGPPDASGEATSMLVDFEIEGKGGSTVVRLVHSGFGDSADWDQMYDAMESGWAYFLFNLAFYLVRHRGSVRRMISARRGTTEAVADVWRRLLGRAGMNVDGIAPGEKHSLKLGNGIEQPGQVKIVRELRSFAATLETLNDGLIFVEMEGGSPAWHCGVWISLYDVSDERAAVVQDALTTLMDEVFAAA